LCLEISNYKIQPDVNLNVDMYNSYSCHILMGIIFSREISKNS